MISLILSMIAFAQECPRSKIKKVAVVDNALINEASGMVVTDELIWIHNDSGDSPTLYALSLEGQTVGRATIQKAFARDWESMSSFIQDGQRYFLIGDIGDNKERKSFIEFYVVKEPTHFGDIALEYSFTAEYDVGPKDAEAMFVSNGEVIVITKGREGISYWLRGTLPKSKGHIVLHTFHTEHIYKKSPSTKKEMALLKTAASFSAEKGYITRNYLSAKLWMNSENQDLDALLSQQPCTIPLPLQQQGETLAFTPDGRSLFTLSEGRNPILYRIDLLD